MKLQIIENADGFASSLGLNDNEFSLLGIRVFKHFLSFMSNPKHHREDGASLDPFTVPEFYTGLLALCENEQHIACTVKTWLGVQKAFSDNPIILLASSVGISEREAASRILKNVEQEEANLLIQIAKEQDEHSRD